MRLVPLSSLFLLVLVTRPALECQAADPTAEASPSTASASLAAHLSSSLPKFTPRPAKGPLPASADPEPGAPRNGIIRLPNYIVRDKKIPEFKQRQMLTPAGRLDLALKRHPGLKIGPFASLNKGPALQMLAEEQALERRAEMSDLSGNVSLFDALRAEEEAADRPAAPLK